MTELQAPAPDAPQPRLPIGDWSFKALWAHPVTRMALVGPTALTAVANISGIAEWAHTISRYWRPVLVAVGSVLHRLFPSLKVEDDAVATFLFTLPFVALGAVNLVRKDYAPPSYPLCALAVFCYWFICSIVLGRIVSTMAGIIVLILLLSLASLAVFALCDRLFDRVLGLRKARILALALSGWTVSMAAVLTVGALDAPAGLGLAAILKFLAVVLLFATTYCFMLFSPRRLRDVTLLSAAIVMLSGVYELLAAAARWVGHFG
jgi:hypothetical protein